MLLEFEKNILEESTPCSNLLVFGRGMGKEKIMYHQLKFYFTPRALVIALNFSNDEISFFKEMTDSKYLHFEVPTVGDKRKEFYNRGGIFILSETSFISDLVNNFIDVKKISAFFISNVEYLKKDSTIEFILDFTKKYNSEVIIRGFTDNPLLLNIELALGILQVDKVFFYPRFAESVKNSLKKDTDFLEKRIKMSKEIEEIQILILEIIRSILNELKREDKFNYELKEIVEDFDLSKIPRLNKITKEMIERLGYKNNVRRLVKDINDFRIMIGFLFSIDFSCFFSLLDVLWNEQVSLRDRSTWINYESGMMLMDKCSLYTTKNLDVKNKDEKESKLPSKQLLEIKNKRIKKEQDDLFCDSESEDYEEQYSNISITSNKFGHEKMKILDELIKEQKGKTLILVQSKVIKGIIKKIMAKNGVKIDENESYKGKLFQFIPQLKNKIVTNIMTHFEFKFSEQIYENVIFVDPDLGSIRKIEILQNRAEISELENKSTIKKIYFIIYRDSLEEQKYLNEIRNEKNCFKSLIEKFTSLPLTTKNSRIYLNDDEEDLQKEFTVLVDFREMRCKLPFYLYRAGNLMNIVSLETADYILTKDTCVERKTIPDLISSLNSGRLYLQAKMMTYKFNVCYLLIEFNKRPCLSDYFENTEKYNLMNKLVLFMLNFPKIRLIWSNSQLLTTKIFRILQKRGEQPNKNVEMVDPVLLEIVLSIPGIDCFNYKRVMNSFKNIKEISQASLAQLIYVVGKEKGNIIYNFFNKRL